MTDTKKVKDKKEEEPKKNKTNSKKKASSTKKKTAIDKRVKDVVSETPNVESKKIRVSKVSKSRKKFNGILSLDILDLLIVVVVVAIFSCLVTGAILTAKYQKNYSGIDYDIVSDTNLSNFIKTYSEVVDNFYEEVDSQGMIESALDGMMKYLEDNYSIYLNKDDSTSLNETLDSSYEGIGTHALGNVIVNVYKDSPADKAGIKVDDVIVEINGNVIDNKNYYLMSEYLNESGKDNTIVVERKGERITFTLSVATVSIPVVYTKVIEKNENNIGYLSLSQFSTKSYDEFKKGLESLEDKGITSLIIDLRDNTGGYLNSAKDITSLFIKKGELLYSLQNKDEVKEVKDETKDYREYPIVVLVNNSTASAAEILASALKDTYGATIVGNITFGKGKVQNLLYYGDTMVKYTSAKWLRPNGDCVDGIGIEPDYIENIAVKNNIIYDNQLDKAISLLGK